MSGKYSQKLFDFAKQSATDAFKTASKGTIQKTPEAADNLIGNKIANRILKVPKNSQQNNSETVTYVHGKKTSPERYRSSVKKRQEILMIWD